VNSQYYVLERSGNGGEFQSINQQIANNFPGQQKYSFNDDTYLKEINFYRLKLVATDDSYTYSDTIKIDNRTATGLTISPNPVRKEFTLSATFPETGPLTIRIIDITGRVVKQISDNVNSGFNTLTINQLQVLKAGAYILEVRQKNYSETKKFVKMD